MTFGGLEAIFNPSAVKARDEIEKQKLIGEALPSPADPPQLDPAGEITDQPGERFKGKIVIRRKP
jgi:hypothetical protein